MEEKARRYYHNSSNRTYAVTRRAVRNNGSEVRKKTYRGDTGDMRERVISQCILSGVVLIVVLAICLIDTDLTNGIRYSIKTAISNDIDPNSITDGLGEIADSYAGMKNVLNTIFGGVSGNDPNYIENETPEEYPGDTYTAGSIAESNANTDDDYLSVFKPDESALVENANSMNAVNETDIETDTGADAAAVYNEPAGAVDDDFRIDEDILEQINSRVDFYYVRNAK